MILSRAYNQYKYYFNREDNFFLTDNHDFSSKFTIETVNLSVFPKEDIKLNFGYRHWERDGDAGVPQAIPSGCSPGRFEGGNERVFHLSRFSHRRLGFSY